MHAGMAVEADPVPSRAPGPQDEPAPRPLFAPALLRVEHPMKGAGEGFFAGLEGPRPVQAVTGSFILVSRALFEELGGFSGDYVFAYYEDADFCLRAAAAGADVLCDPALRFIHLEGRGSGPGTPGPVAGAMLFNRCLFTDRHLGAASPASSPAATAPVSPAASPAAFPAAGALRDAGDAPAARIRLPEAAP